MKTLTVTKANYVEGFKLHIYFNDNTDRIIDFENYLFNYEFAYPEYRQVANFKKFKIDKGELVWGKNWDIIFPIYKLHSGKILNRKQVVKSKPYLSFEL
jgi:hypothetical protein